MQFMEKWGDQAYALLRIVSGFLFIFHSQGKLEKVIAGEGGWVHWIGGPVELIGGLLIMVGLFTSPAAFLSSGMMAVAYWYAHAPQGLLPIENRGELAIMFCFVFLLISTRGAGIWSIDALRAGKSSDAE